MRYCLTQLPPEFQRFELAENGSLWRGIIRCGSSDLPSETGRQMIGLCRDLLNGSLTMIKDRPKIAAGTGRDFFVKLYKLPGLQAQICRRFRQGRALHCLFAAQALLACQAVTPPVAAALELRRGQHICDFLITDKLPDDCRTLNYVFSENTFPVDEALDFLTGKILPEVSRLHNAGIAHGDLNLRNIYPADGRAGFIDLDSAVCIARPLSIPVREKELARLLSGVLRFENFRKFDTAGLAEKLTAAYLDVSGVQCNKMNIIRRAEYLLSRCNI